jgi:hypothetical protein
VTRGGTAGQQRASTSKAATWGLEGDRDVELDEDKVQEALERLREPESSAATGKKSSEYHGLAADSTTVTAEEMEAYRRHRSRPDDPMQSMRNGADVADGFEMV